MPGLAPRASLPSFLRARAGWATTARMGGCGGTSVSRGGSHARKATGPGPGVTPEKEAHIVFCVRPCDGRPVVPGSGVPRAMNPPFSGCSQSRNQLFPWAVAARAMAVTSPSAEDRAWSPSRRRDEGKGRWGLTHPMEGLKEHSSCSFVAKNKKR